MVYLRRKTDSQQQGGNSMVRHASLFSQLVAIFNRNQFHSLVFRQKAERYSKGFYSWDHWTAKIERGNLIMNIWRLAL